MTSHSPTLSAGAILALALLPFVVGRPAPTAFTAPATLVLTTAASA